MTGMMWGRTPSGKAAKVQVTEEGAVVVSGAVGGGGGGTSNTTEATQLDVLAKAASIDDKTPPLVGGAVPVVGPLTDAQLRAAPVPVTVAGAATEATAADILAAVATLDPLTDVQLRAAELPVRPNSFNTKLREAFETFDYQSPDSPWLASIAPGDIVQVDGNCAGASYLVISKSPFSPGVTTIESRAAFPMPLEIAFGAHRSQPAIGQESALEVVSTDPLLPALADIQIASISQTTTTLTIDTVLPHGLVPGKRIGVRDCADSRANYPALVVASTPTPTRITATSTPGATIPSLTIAAQTSGYIYPRPALGYAADGTSMILETAAATTASFYVRGAGGDALPSGTAISSHPATIASTASVQIAIAAAAYSFQPTSEQRLSMFVDQVQWSDAAMDATAQATARRTVRSVVPSPDKQYKVRARVTNYPGFTRPVARIVSVMKSGTTTAVVTTDQPHMLAVTDYVNAYGVRDQSAFPALAATVVTAVDSPTVFRVTWGTAVSTTSFGGYVSRVNGSVAQVGAVAQAVQSAAVSGGLLALVGSATWAGVVVGDYVNAYGLRNAIDGGDMGLDGAYRVRETATSTLVLEPIGDTVLPASLGTTNCGGGIIRRTDLRLSYVRLLDFERLRVEMLARPASDASAAAPVTVQNTAIVSAIGYTAVDSPMSSPIPVGGRASNANIPGMSATGDLVGWLMTMIGVGVTKPFSLPEADWSYLNTLTTTADTAVKAAGGTGIKHYVTAIQVQNTNATATQISIKSGTTAVFTISLPASMAEPRSIEFPTPIQTVANAALNIACGTAGANVLVNMQGYTAP